jgi:hypothetical protein
MEKGELTGVKHSLPVLVTMRPNNLDLFLLFLNGVEPLLLPPQRGDEEIFVPLCF